MEAYVQLHVVRWESRSKVTIKNKVTINYRIKIKEDWMWLDEKQVNRSMI